MLQSVSLRQVQSGVGVVEASGSLQVVLVAGLAFLVRQRPPVRGIGVKQG